MYGYAYIHMQTCAYVYVHMCEINIKDICSCVHVYMQMGVYMKLFAYVHVCVYAYMEKKFLHVIFG